MSSALSSLTNFYKQFTKDIDLWKKYYDLSSPEEHPLPKPYDTVEEMLYLIILKSLRPDKVVPAVRVSMQVYLLYPLHRANKGLCEIRKNNKHVV